MFFCQSKTKQNHVVGDTYPTCSSVDDNYPIVSALKQLSNILYNQYIYILIKPDNDIIALLTKTPDLSHSNICGNRLPFLVRLRGAAVHAVAVGPQPWTATLGVLQQALGNAFLLPGLFHHGLRSSG